MIFHTKRSGLTLGVSAVAMAAALAFTSPAFAQTGASIQGHVAGGGTGTTVTATDANTGERVSANVGADGNYVIVGLRPGAYHIQAGSGSAEDVTLETGTTTTLDLDAAAATVTVVGRRKEVRTSEVATNVSTRQIENLPQNDRNFMNFAALAPGVIVSTDPNSRTFKAGAGSSNQVNVFIDGQSYKNQVGGGGFAGQDFSPGNPFPQLAVQEFKVSTQNFKAEYEQAGTAIISAVTKSGGTEFHGQIFDEIMNEDMYGRPYFDRPGNANNPNGTNPKPPFNRSQFGAEIGGPIIKNKLHFYLSYEGTKQDNPSTLVNLVSPVPSSIISANNGTFSIPFKQDLLFGKLTWFATDADTVDFSYFNRKEDNFRDFGGIEAYEHGRSLQIDFDEYQVEWKHRGDNYLNEAKLARQTTLTGTPAITHAPEVVLTVNGGDAAHLGGHFFEQYNTQELTTFKDDLTLTGWDWHGSHVVKMGVKIASTKLARAERWWNNGSYYFDAAGYTGLSSTIPYKAKISKVDNVKGYNVDDTQVGLYLQDDWTYDEHWTFNLGIRWDYETNMNNNKYVTPANVAAALRAYQPWKAAGINAENYISDGHNRDVFYGAFQPRLGFSYDIDGDRSTVIFGGYGRYYSRNIFGPAQIEPLTQTIRDESEVQFCGATGLAACTGAANELAWDAKYRDPSQLRAAVASANLKGDIWALNNDTKTPFSDQLNLGVRHRFGDINVSVTLAHNEDHDQFEYVRGNRMMNGTYDANGNDIVKDGFPEEGNLHNPNGTLFATGKINIGTNNRESRYNAIYVQVEKPYTRESKYGYTGTLTLTDSKTLGGETDGDEYFWGPDNTIHGWQYTPGVDKMRFVGTGIVSGPWDTTISGTLTLASGPAFGGIWTSPFLHGSPTGVYFPKDKLAYQDLDLRIAKDFTLPNGNVITIDGQVFNVFDHVNRTYSAWGAGMDTTGWGGGPATLKENSTTGYARSYQVGIKYKF